MKNSLLKTIENKKSSSIGAEMLICHNRAMELIEKENPNLTKDDFFALNQYQSALEFIPASESFMKKVKKMFTDKQINYTIQNYLTWHYIDAILLSFFRVGDRLDRFKKCAVTEIDNIFVEGIEFMLSLKDMTMDEIRFAYFKCIGHKYLPHFYFYNKSDKEIEDEFSVLLNKAPNSQSIETEYALQILFFNLPEYRFMLQESLSARKSRFGASPVKMNEKFFGNILFKGLTGQFKPLEKGDVQVKEISNLNDIKEYFVDRRNSYSLLSEKGVKVYAAHINNTVVGVIGYRENNRMVVNIHVDADYRNKGISKMLLAEVIKNTYILNVVPIGDSLDYVKRISKYDRRKNIGVITLETLSSKIEKRNYPKGISIKDSDISPLDVVSDNFKAYLNKNYDIDSLSVKEAKINDERLGYAIFDKEKKKIAVIEVSKNYSNMGIGKMILNSVLDYNIWSADIGKAGILFWVGKGEIDGSIIYLSKSDSKLAQFVKKNKIVNTAPQYHIDL